jgi:hypothetical protein
MAGENDSIKSKAALSALKSFEEHPFVKHQWEELVMNVRQTDDPRLLAMIDRETDRMQEKDPDIELP